MKVKYVFRHTKAEMIHQQTYTTRNVKRSLSGKKKMIPDGNLDLYKGMKNTRNGNYVGKYFFLFI